MVVLYNGMGGGLVVVIGVVELLCYVFLVYCDISYWSE